MQMEHNMWNGIQYDQLLSRAAMYKRKEIRVAFFFPVAYANLS